MSEFGLRFVCRLVAVFGIGLLMAGNFTAAAQTIDTFNVPGASMTSPLVINSAGRTGGSYQDATGAHGFFRDRHGNFTTFDAPGTIVAISEKGEVAGTDGNTAPDGSTLLFVRELDGTTTTFNIVQPGNQTSATIAGINSAGQVSGTFRYGFNPATQIHQHGFVREADGTIATFPDDGPSLPLWTVAGINPAGSVIGFVQDIGGFSEPFVRQADGTVTFPDGFVLARFTAMNRKGQIAGFGIRNGNPCLTGQVPCAFVRELDSSVTLFTVPNATQVTPIAINQAGTVAGFYSDASNQEHGFLRQADGSIATFDAANAVNTHPTYMNAEGDVTGWYSDAAGVVHGFVRLH